MAGSLNATWNLGSTDGVISVTLNALIAGMVDRVQPFAIVACQRFGNTIPMCDRTIDIIRTKALPAPDSRIIKFLKAFVGFSGDDCASQFGESQDGLRFLSLAAALISSMDLHDAKVSLEALMLDAVSKNSNNSLSVPKPQIIRDLLAALEPRCMAVGFSDLTLTWHSRIYNQTSLPFGFMGDSDSPGTFPDPEGLKRLIAAFRKLYRIGDATAKRVIIKSSGCTAWVASFTEWCLGVPPEVYASNGQHIWGERHQGVCIIHFSANDERSTPPGLGVKVDDTIRSFEELMSDDAARMDCSVNLRWRGMPSIDEYGKWLLQRSGLSSEFNKRAFEELIPFAVHQVINNLRFSSYHEFQYKSGLEGWLPRGEFLSGLRPSDHISESISELRTYPFPESDTIASMLSRLTSLGTDPGKPPLRLRSLRDGVRIEDLPIVSIHLDKLKQRCRCFKCRDSPLSEEMVHKYCERDAFFDKICNVIADTLALSLFEYPEELHVRVPMSYHQDRRHDFTRSIYGIITTGSLTVTNFYLLLDWALTLAGHDVAPQLRAHSWAASSNMGQAIWPTVFDTMIPIKHGFLSLKYQRGIFHYGKETYTLVETFDNDYEMANTEGHDLGTPITESGNYFQGVEVDWRVKVSDDILKVGLGLKGIDKKLAYITVSPGRALANLSSALVVEDCHHDIKDKLEGPDHFATHTHPLDPGNPLRADDIDSGLVAVVPVSGKPDLRLISLACGDYYAPIVLRNEACLSCCLRVCRESTYPILVL